MNIMKHIKRDICEEHHDEYGGYRDRLRELFDHKCCYCTLNEGENDFGYFNIDHFRPKKKFPHLETAYENLYYACQRCNVYKRDNWISKAAGCIRNCNLCENKKCEDIDYLRFIDPCKEDPLEFFLEDEDCQILDKANVLAARYTIEKLRLNRKQLVNLRFSRRELSMWINAQLDRMQKCEERLIVAQRQLNELEDVIRKFQINGNDDKYIKACILGSTLLKQKVCIYEGRLLEIQEDIKKVSDVINGRLKPYEW